MPVERFFIDEPLVAKKTITLKNQEFHHLVRVIRMQEGESVELINGKGLLGFGEIQKVTKKDAEVYLEAVHQEKKPSYETILAQAIPRINRLDFIVEKATELGISALWLFPGDLSEKKDLTPNQKERLHTLMIAATKQCGRLFLPEITFMPPLQEWKKPPYTCFYGDIYPKAPSFINALQAVALKDNILFFIGPEGGFSEKEEQLLKKIATGVKLNQNILRTDTAALCSLSILQCMRSQ